MSRTAGRSAPPGSRPGTDQEVLLEERAAVRAPRMYRVLLHNDDYTTMEFVVAVLIQYFDHDVTGATRIMLQVHHAGVGVAGRFTRDEAETRAEQATAEARRQGFPLLLTVEPE